MANTSSAPVWGDAVTSTRLGTSAADQAQLYPVGEIRWEGCKRYIYVKYVKGTAAVVPAAGNLLYWSLTVEGTVTGDLADSKRNLVAGVAVSVLPDTGFGWIQTWGLSDNPVTDNGDDDISGGDTIIASSTTNLCDSVAAGTASTYQVVGMATAADSDANNNVAVFLRISH